MSRPREDSTRSVRSDRSSRDSFQGGRTWQPAESQPRRPRMMSRINFFDDPAAVRRKKPRAKQPTNSSPPPAKPRSLKQIATTAMVASRMKRALSPPTQSKDAAAENTNASPPLSSRTPSSRGRSVSIKLPDQKTPVVTGSQNPKMIGFLKSEIERERNLREEAVAELNREKRRREFAENSTKELKLRLKEKSPTASPTHCDRCQELEASIDDWRVLYHKTESERKSRMIQMYSEPAPCERCHQDELREHKLVPTRTTRNPYETFRGIMRSLNDDEEYSSDSSYEEPRPPQRRQWLSLTV